MNHQDINEILTNSDALALVSVGELQSLCNQYPYMSSLRLMLVKKLYQTQSATFETELNMAATYVLDRKFLYNYLHDTNTTKRLAESSNDNATSMPPIEIVENGATINDNDYDEWVEDVEIKNEANASIEEDIDQRLKDIINQFKSRNEDEHLKEAVSRIRNMELGGNPKTAISMEIPNEQKVFYLTDDLEEIKADGLETTDFFTNNEIDWEEERLTTIIEFVENAELESQKMEEVEDKKLEKNEEMMSEALAELLVSQGNKEKAIDMYEYLILKFPEKKRFFAQKIEDLRE